MTFSYHFSAYSYQVYACLFLISEISDTFLLEPYSFSAIHSISINQPGRHTFASTMMRGICG